MKSRHSHVSVPSFLPIYEVYDEMTNGCLETFGPGGYF